MVEHYLDRLARIVVANWDAPALSDFYLTDDGTAQDTSRGYNYTYGEMYTEVVRVAEFLQQLGLKQGDHIAICGSNSAHWVIAYLAIAKMRGVSVTIMQSLMPEQVVELVNLSDAKALFTDANIWAELQDLSIPQVQTVVSLCDWSCFLSTTNPVMIKTCLICPQEVSFPLCEKDELAMIGFTSGSTSEARGVKLSYRNISNNAQNITDGYPEDENTNFLSVLPMSHIYGFMTEIIGQLLKVKHINLLTSLLTVSNLYTAINCVRPYALSLIPELVSGLMRMYPNTPEILLACCKQIYIGGASFDKELERKLLDANVPISIGYGTTETAPLISYSMCDAYRYGTCGKIVDGMTARIAPNGEILVKGENVMLGYYKNPEATAKKIDKDGWLHTGDRGHLDEDGYLYVEGRLEQDMIVLPNGENIHPDNIESKINALPEVAESIVIAREGKLVAIVVPKTEVAPEDQKTLRLSILRSVNAQLPMYAQIYDIEWSDEPLARTAKQTLKRHLYK